MKTKSDEIVSLAYHRGIYTRYSPVVLRAMGGELQSTNEVEGQGPVEVWEFEDGSELAIGDAFAAVLTGEKS